MYTIVLTNRVPLIHQQHLLRFPVKAWIAGIHHHYMRILYKNDFGYAQLAVNPTIDEQSRARYIAIHSNYMRPDENSLYAKL